MVTVKILGALLILGVGAVSAISAVKYEKMKLSVTDGWIDLIFYIRGQIDCYLTPLSEILSDEESAHFKATLSDKSETDLSAILRSSSIYLDGESKRLLERFVREIGTCYREEQVRRCDYYITALRAQRERIAKDTPIRIRLAITLCFCIAVGSAILLW